MKNMLQTMIKAVQNALEKGLAVADAQNSLTLAQLFPKLGANPFMAQVLKMNIGHLYELYRK
jgi:hypothetical protein